ncbi:MAG: hypothetical protein QXO84_03600 [Candidatus Aenigmatarchaeota archaeon]
MEENIFLLGIFLVLIGVFLIILSSFRGKVEYGFGGFIGPIPFGWATNQKILIIIIILMMLLILFLYR